MDHKQEMENLGIDPSKIGGTKGVHNREVFNKYVNYYVWLYSLINWLFQGVSEPLLLTSIRGCPFLAWVPVVFQTSNHSKLFFPLLKMMKLHESKRKKKKKLQLKKKHKRNWYHFCLIFTFPLSTCFSFFFDWDVGCFVGSYVILWQILRWVL